MRESPPAVSHNLLQARSASHLIPEQSRLTPDKTPQLERHGPSHDPAARAARPRPGPDPRLPVLPPLPARRPSRLRPRPPVAPFPAPPCRQGARPRRRRIGRRQRGIWDRWCWREWGPAGGWRGGRGRGREDGGGALHVAEAHPRLRRARRSWWGNGVHEEWKPEVIGCRRHISPAAVLCPHSTPSETCLCIVDRVRYIGCTADSHGISLQEVREDIPSGCRVPSFLCHGRRLLPWDLA